MAQVRGSDSTIALYEETTYNQAPGTPAGYLMYLTSFGLQKTQNRIQSNILSGERSRAEGVLGNVDVTGDVVTEIHSETMSRLIKHALGTVATTGTGPYTHTATIANLPVGLTMEIDYGSTLSGAGRFVQYHGCRIGQVTFNFPVEGPATSTFSMTGASITQASAALDTSLTDDGATPFSAFDATIDEGGSAIATVQSVDVTLNNELDTSGYTIGGSGTRRQLPEGFATISGNITALFEDLTLLNKALNQTETSLKVIMQRGVGDGSAGNEYFELLVEQLKYAPTTPPVDGPGGLLVKLPFTAYRSGTQKGLQIITKNQIATL